MTGSMEQPRVDHDASPLWAVLAQAADVLERSPEEAERQAQAILNFAPGQQQAIQLIVSARRAQGDMAGARTLLETIAAELPDLATPHYELGLLLAEMGDNRAAINSLRRVVELEPKHPQAWRALGDALVQDGDTDGAANAYALQFASSVMDLKMLEQVTTLDLDQLEVAGNMLREFLTIYPTDLTALQMLGKTHVRVNQFEAAEQAFGRALDLDPSFEIARAECVWVLHQQMKWEEECEQLDILLQNEPSNPDYRYLKAVALAAAGRLQESVQYCEDLLKDEPDQPKFWMAYGYGLRVDGRQQDCIAAFRKAIQLEPGFGEAWWGLANLKTVRFAPADMEIMRAGLAQENSTDENRQSLHFALGKALEDAHAYDESFEHYRAGNALVRAKYPYNPDEVTENLRLDQQRFTRDYFAAHASHGNPSRDPIFILGLARSGSTLVEQILASHSSVEAGGELPHITAIARRIKQNEQTQPEPADGNAPTPFEGQNLNALGDEYLELCRKFRKGARPFFTDKATNNFLHLGLITAILPNAKIIDTRRHPLACCFSNFKQVFPSPLGPSYDIVDMGHYYREYVRFLSHFDRVLPGRIHRVLYEELVGDPEKEIRRLLDYCGLPFEEACLRFYETDRNISTVSSEQVRRPVYTDSLEQWRHYDRWLGPLKAALGPVLVAYPSVPETF